MMARGRPRRAVRMAILVAFTAPLLAVGPCLTIAQKSAINGFFNAVTPLVVERVADDLGVSTTTGGSSTADGS